MVGLDLHGDAGGGGAGRGETRMYNLALCWLVCGGLRLLLLQYPMYVLEEYEKLLDGGIVRSGRQLLAKDRR